MRCALANLIGFAESGLDERFGPHGIDRGLPDRQRVFARHRLLPFPRLYPLYNEA